MEEALYTLPGGYSAQRTEFGLASAQNGHCHHSYSNTGEYAKELVFMTAKSLNVSIEEGLTFAEART